MRFMTLVALPEVLRKYDFLSNIFGSGGTSGYYRGAFGRYDKKALFATILTSLRPAKKNGFCIHPEVCFPRRQLLGTRLIQNHIAKTHANNA